MTTADLIADLERALREPRSHNAGLAPSGEAAAQDRIADALNRIGLVLLELVQKP